jgi:hypothetical protein
MKVKNSDWDQEWKPRKVLKGADKTSKHRKSIYNMLFEEEDDLDFESDESEILRNYDHYAKPR